MSEICIYVKLPTYLKQWFVNVYSGEPVHLERGSAETVILRQNLAKWPEGTLPEKQKEDEVAICIPTFKSGPDPRYYNYLPPRAMNLLATTIRNNFLIQFNVEMSTFVRRGGEQQDAVYAYMERHGIEQNETNYLALAKIFARSRFAYLQDKRRAKKSNQNCQKNHSDFRNKKINV